jgi:hypothetical protein
MIFTGGMNQIYWIIGKQLIQEVDGVRVQLGLGSIDRSAHQMEQAS